MKLFFAFFVTFQVYAASVALSFQPEWHPYVVQVIAHHKECTLSPMILNPLAILQPAAETNSVIEAHQFFIPDVIIWDPIHQFPSLFKDISCLEDGCDRVIKFKAWQDGSSMRYNPRCLYGIHGCVLLVCPIYCCARGHTITACDPRMLQHFPEREIIPFILLHKCGVTRQLQRLIFQLCSQGKSFSDIETLLLWSVQDQHAQQQLMYTHHHHFLTHSYYHTQPIPKVYISNDLITNIFIITFNELKNLMFHDMCELTSEVVSCDHTFKLATHIGILRCGKWIPQYDSLFIMQNELGEVLFWQLTMGTGYGSIQDGLESLHSRMIKKGKSLKMVLIDNCCMWKKKLKNTFGEQLDVKLDLFHAVKRVTTALSKKHSYFYPAIQEFRLVFRSHGDNGLQRTKNTPSPTILLKNIKAFLSKWDKILDDNGKPVVTKAVMDEIDKLKVHIERGCLSDIPPHFGTNRNENLHRSLNKRLTGSRLGVEIAVALLATFFHCWNLKQIGSATISTKATFLTDLAEHIKCSGSLKRAECSYSHTFGIGVSSKRTYTHDNVRQQKSISRNACSTLHEISDYKIKGALSETVYTILHHAFSMLYTEEILNNLSPTHCKVSRLLPCQLRNAQSWVEKQYADSDQQRLLNVLESFDLELVGVPADGDCLFTSVALFIQQCFKTPENSEFIQHLRSLSLGENLSPQSIIQKLRDLLVEEWLHNKADYLPFFESNIDSFDSEAQLYRQSGVYSTSLGDAMLLGLANVLHLQFIVFTSIESWPHIPIHPRFPPLTQNPLYLAYLQKGSGHYSLARSIRGKDAMVGSTNNEDQSSLKPNCGCRCGRGRNAMNQERINCSAEQAYSTRCPCHKSKVPCSDLCRCQNCGNKYGKRPQQKPTEEQVKLTRKKRPRYPEQDRLKESGWKYMKLQNEQTIAGIWTPHEHYVFVAIVEHCRSQQSSLEAEEITAIYESIRNTDFISDVLSVKTASQVKAKLDQLLKEEGISKVCGSTNYFS